MDAANEDVKLIYGLDDCPPPQAAFFAALQQVLAMFVGTITPPLIIASALDYDIEMKGFLVSMALLTCGLGTLVQVHRIGFLGAGMLSITGTSFGFVPLLIEAGREGGPALMYGLSFAAAPIQFLIAPFLVQLRGFLTPVVTGTVILVIGLSLIPSAVGAISQEMAAGVPMGMSYAVAGIVIVLVLFFFGLGLKWARLGAIFYALMAGYALCAVLGFLAEPATNVRWFELPIPVRYGFAFDPGMLIGFMMLYLVSSMETVGDLTATSAVSRQPTTGPVYWSRIRGGLLADGFNSMMAAVLSAFPNTTFSQNNGVVLMTGVASRRVGYYVAGILVFLGLVPAIGQWLARMPGPVLGGTTLVLFGFIAVSGIRMLAGSVVFNERTMLIVAMSVAASVANQANPDILGSLPSPLNTAFSSNVATGGFTALILNIVLPRPKPKKDPEPSDTDGSEIDTPHRDPSS